MNTLKTVVFSFLLLGVSFGAQANLPDFTKIVEASKASIVNISTVKKSATKELRRNIQIPDFPDGSPLGEFFKKFLGEDGLGQFRPKDSASLGSGFIISSDGYILTNHHVIADADDVVVRLSSREEYHAKIIGSDKKSDVALLKVDTHKKLPALKFGDSNKLKVGEWVLAIGSPFGFDQTVTAGIVSAKGRSLPNENYVPFIQTDVAINPGNSGGPLFNLKGEVVGINSQIYSRSGGFMGLSFAIPIEMAVDVAEQIKNKGSVSRGWLGVLIQEVTAELAESFGMKTPHGALVAKILKDSPAENSGLQVGDVIVEFNGVRIARSSGLPPVVGRAPVGEPSTLKVLRNKKERTLQITIEQLPDDMTQARNEEPTRIEAKVNTVLGMNIIPLKKTTQQVLGIDSGAEVDKVIGGAAKEAKIRAGDVITMLDNQTITSVEDFERVAKSLNKGQSVAVLVQRKSGPVFLAIRP